MKKFVTFVILMLLAMCGCSVKPPPALSPPSHDVMATALRASVVALVEAEEDGGARAYCTGTWVSDTEILTANHCVEDEPIADFVTYSDVFPNVDPWLTNKKFDVRHSLVVKRDVPHDLALLRAIQIPTHTIAKTYAGYAHPGMSVQTLGNPLGLWFSYSSGEVAACRKMESVMGIDMYMIQATAAISPGNSGGALFTEDGEILGVVHGSFQRGENVNIFIDTRYVRAFLAK